MNERQSHDGRVHLACVFCPDAEWCYQHMLRPWKDGVLTQQEGDCLWQQEHEQRQQKGVTSICQANVVLYTIL
jgi:hypothetical protein